MGFDFSKIKPKKKESLPINPIELFQKIKVTDPNINDLWLAQGDALRQWHENRSKEDVGIVLNTGAGKTLVGLLVAQSLVNETRGKVPYACSSIQLVEQTAEKAKGYGLNVTTYYRGEYSNDLFNRCEVPCVTTYQALFNGRSVFFREQLSAIVFDDAHTAEHLLRDHFSLRISSSTLQNIYSQIVALFRDYHEMIGKAGSYAELDDSQSRRLFLIPPFEIYRKQGELTRILQEARFQDNPNTTFVWEHIKDHIDICCILISGSDVTITPPFIPILSLPYFERGLRRVYLSATLSAPDAFARTFGKNPDKLVAPSTTAGECERLILLPSKSVIDMEDIEVTKTLITARKTLILVPTYKRANSWQDIALQPPRDEVSQHVQNFRNTSDATKLLLTARYDGIDLPGDTCRVMVIDDVPMGVGPLERFLWEQLGMANTLRSAVASRIIQSFGRISRGMSDQGVVILTGNRLVDWILIPKNRAVLPPFLQKQIALGDEVSKNAETLDDLVDIINKCLKRDNDWATAYNDFMANAVPENSNVDTDLLTRLAISEAQYGLYMWQREYENAAQVLSSTLNDAFSLSANTGAWHSLWLGAAYLFLGDNERARKMFIKAHTNQRNIPPYPREESLDENSDIPAQIISVSQQLKITSSGKIDLPNTFDTDIVFLNGSGTPAQTEESLRALGQYLGLVSSRPDNEFGTGPDVLWLIEGMQALCMEVKSDKDPSSRYQKKEVGQLSDHIQWVKDTVDTEEIIPVFVGPLVGVTNTANPPEDFQVIALEQFKNLAGRLKAALQDAATEALPLTLSTTLLDTFRARNLIWPEVLETLERYKLREI